MSASDQKKTKGRIKIPQRSSLGLKNPAGSLRGDLGGPQMVIEDIGQLGNGLPAETAIGGEPEFRQIFSRRCEPLRKARHVVNGAQIDAGASRLKLAQRHVEQVVAAVEHGNVDPVHRPSGCRHKSVGELDRLAEIVRSKARPTPKRAEAEVITERDLARDMR